MLPNIRVSEPKRDPFREASFKDSYGISVPIFVQNYNDENWDWVKAVLKFHANNHVITLTEYFNEGKDNGTKYVELEHLEDKHRFDKFIDAELKLVDLIRNL